MPEVIGAACQFLKSALIVTCRIIRCELIDAQPCAWVNGADAAAVRGGAYCVPHEFPCTASLAAWAVAPASEHEKVSRQLHNCLDLAVWALRLCSSQLCMPRLLPVPKQGGEPDEEVDSHKGHPYC